MTFLLSSSEDHTQAHGAALASAIFGFKKKQRAAEPFLIQLIGEVGAGKTAFCRGFINQWMRLYDSSVDAPIQSPTFNLARVYGDLDQGLAGDQAVAHLDLYRLHSQEELNQIGFEKYFYETPVCLVEWLEQIPRFKDLYPTDWISVAISFDEAELLKRKLEFSGPPHMAVTLEFIKSGL